MKKHSIWVDEFQEATPRNHQGKLISLCMGVFILVFASCSPPAAPAPTPRPAGGANSVVISTVTPAPASSSPSPEPSVPTLALTDDAKITGGLPGLSPRNVTVSLEQNRFTCTEVKQGITNYERTCTRGVPSVQVFQVVISGRTPAVVDHIKASILQYENPDPQIAIQILSLLAVLPYDGTTPEEARAWIESTVPALNEGPAGAQEQRFGGVKYVLHGPPTALVLELGEWP